MITIESNKQNVVILSAKFLKIHGNDGIYRIKIQNIVQKNIKHNI